MLNDFAAIMGVTKDKRFVTARHSLQSLWKIGLAGERQKQMLLSGLALRFEQAETEKNGSLIRFDIIESLCKLYDRDGNEAVKQAALAWIETEADPKYR
ncbi:hypothetical protein [Paenibacillus sp. S150]|uniref:hypothetical protein n=1 Tax=Paenibacillus sp. S150 TaxID=2749826 RepID=UPI001C582546|nr:hypothetical protein [Paenibacillus sp. S150]MBW4083148.1 hypothetical protein [Paenibacillus sp. S150]